MGADNKSIFAKCGEILINIKTKKKKTKVYQFNCAFCDSNCDQLKKFSKHLETKHSQEFKEDSAENTSVYEPEISMPIGKKEPQDFVGECEESTSIFVPEIKLEELTKGENDDISTKQLRTRKSEDPLQTGMAKRRPTNLKTESSMDVNIKDENEGNPEEEEEENEEEDYKDEDYSCNFDMFENENIVDTDGNNDSDDNKDSDDEMVDQDDKKKCNEKNKKMHQNRKRKAAKKVRKNKFESDVTSDDSADADFNFDEELYHFNRRNLPIKKGKPIKPDKNNPTVAADEPEPEIDEHELSIALLKAFEKHPILWDVKKRVFNKNLLQKAYEEITIEVNENKEYNIKWEDARKRIRQMRFDYSVELEKQRKGQEHEIPWYWEHMKYLEENIEVLLKGRYEVSKYRPLKTMDETELSILIELYKKYEILWQVNNIAFGCSYKRNEIFDKIREELKEKHNLDVTAEHFHRRINYLHRLYSKDKERELKCELENREFIPMSPHYKQMSFLSDSQGPFKCPHCNDIIERYDNYHIHVAKHTNVMPFNCSLCEHTFRKFAHYLTHAKRHLGMNNFHCTYCGKGYVFKAEYEFHLAIHTGEKPYLCQICGESFRVRQKFANHVRAHDNRFRFECHICKRGFNHKNSLDSHIKYHLNIRDCVCSICGKDFTSKKNLSRHLQASHEQKYQCNICGKTFALESLLRGHKKYLHKGEYDEML